MTKKSQQSAKEPIPRIESIFAYMAVGLIGTSILVMMATLIIAASGSATPALGQLVVPPVLIFYPQFGLAAGALSIIGLLIVNIRRRNKENRKNK